MRCLVAVFTILGIAACHHKPPHRPGEEYLDKVEFEGNKRISDRNLLDGLALHRTLDRGRAPDPYAVQVDGDRLKSQYNRLGFFSTDVQSRVDRKVDAVTVTYTIQEGARARSRINVVGLDDPTLAKKVRDKFKLRDGAEFNYDVYDEGKVDALGVVQDNGFAHAKLEAKVTGLIDPGDRAPIADVELKFDPGPKCKFGKVTIEGVEGDLREAVENRVRFEAGDVYSNRAVLRTQRALYGLGRFSTVQVQPDTSGTSDTVDVKIAVSQSAPRQVTLGGGFGMDPLSFEVRGRAGYEVAGFPTDLDKLILDFRPAYAYLRDGSGYEPRIRALARLERQDLFLTYATGSVEVGYNYLSYEAFTEYGPRTELGYEVRLLGDRHFRARVGYALHRYEFRDPVVKIDDAVKAMIGIDHPELSGAYSQALIVDFRDNQVEPRLGIYGEVKVSEGTKYAGGDYTYEQVVPELRGYVPLGPVTLAARVRYGAIFGDIPPTERFYAGGSTSNRGFSERKLSPFTVGTVGDEMVDVPYGGAGLVDTSVETRFPITTVKKMPLGGVVFLDGADVTNTPSELKRENLNWAAGFGLRLMTLIGPARADFGYRLNRTGPDDPQPGSTWAFHLSLGEAF